MSTTLRPDVPTTASPPPTVRTPRAWAWTGVVGGVLALGMIQASMAASVDWETTAGDADAMLADIATKQGPLMAFHVLAVLTMLTLPIVGAGLKRRLDQQGPAGALHGQIALAGLLLTAAALLLGTGLDTQFTFGLSQPELYVPESAAFFTDWVATIPWLWVGAGMSGVAVAVASLRHGAAPRWVGIASLVLGAITVIAGVSPLQYMAGFVGPLWLLVVSLGFAVGDRR